MSKAANIMVLCIDSSTNDTTPSWIRIKKATTLTKTMNPETEDFDYISDETKTTEVKAYAPTFNEDISILPTEPDYEYFYGLYKKEETGADAHHKILQIYVSDGDNTDGFYAEVSDSVISMTDYNTTDGKLNVNIALCGTKTVGTATKSEDVYTFTAE